MTSKIQVFLLSLLTFLFPLLFTPLTYEFYLTPKFALLSIILPLLYFLYFINNLKSKTIHIRNSSLNLTMIFFVLSIFLSLFFSSSNKILSLSSYMGAGFIITLILYFFYINILINNKKYIIYSLIGSTIFLCLLYLISYFELFSIPPPTASLTFLLIFLVSILPLTIAQSFTKTNQFIKSLFGYFPSILIIASLILVGSTYLRQKDQFLPWDIAYKVTIGSYSSGKNLLFGVGPGNFENAFSKNKPLSFNNSVFFNNNFIQSRSFILTLATEFGLIGLIAYLSIIILFLKNIFSDFKKPIFISISLLFASQFLFPTGPVELFLIFSLLPIYLENSSKTTAIKTTLLINLSLALLTLVIFLFSALFSYRFIKADYHFRKSIVFGLENNAKEAYREEQQAIILNPYQDLYRLFYSQTNLELAKNISNSQSKAKLINQSIEQAKIAVSLNPEKAINWQNLGLVYASIGTSESIKWTTNYYNQAIKLDPLNPILRISLARAFYESGDFQSSIQQLKLAISLKPDLGIAHYYLAQTFKEIDEKENAKVEFEQALRLMDKESEEFVKATKEYEIFSKENLKL